MDFGPNIQKGRNIWAASGPVAVVHLGGTSKGRISNDRRKKASKAGRKRGILLFGAMLK
jgi:hypothetical protein